MTGFDEVWIPEWQKNLEQYAIHVKFEGQLINVLLHSMISLISSLVFCSNGGLVVDSYWSSWRRYVVSTGNKKARNVPISL